MNAGSTVMMVVPDAVMKYLHLLSWLSAVILAGLIFAQLPVAEIVPLVTAIPPAMWLVWLMLNMLIICLYVWRWQSLAAAAGPMPGFFVMLGVRQAGQAVSFITPGPQFGGEALQLYWLWKKFRIPGHSTILGLVMDRAYELWINFAVLLIAVLLLFTSPLIPSDDWWNIILVLCVFIGILAAIGWLLIVHPQKILDAGRRLAGRWQHHPRLLNMDAHWNLFSENLRAVMRNKRRTLLAAVFLSVLGWFGMIIELWWLLSLVGVNADYIGFIFVLVAMRLSLLLPLPGGVGSMEAALFWSFQLLGFPVTSAAGLIALIRLRDIVILAAGFFAAYLVHFRSGIARSEG